MPDYSSTTANFPASLARTLVADKSHDNATDRDSTNPVRGAGAHTEAAVNEIRATQSYVLAVTGLQVTDNGGVNIAYTAGRLRQDATAAPVDISASTLALTNNATNYVECNSAGTVSANTTSFTAGYFPMATVICAAGDISSVTDDRTAYVVTAAAGGGNLLADGSVPLTANWDAGGYEIRSLTFESDVTTGTAPFTIASTTLVTNLNADLLDGYHAAGLMLPDGSVPLTANWDAGPYEIRALKLYADVATGTPPFTVASTTKVTSLNAEQVDGKDSTDFVLRDGTQALTAAWDAGSYGITAETFTSDVATGTAPLTVASTTVVTNLNADTVDAKNSTDLVLVDGTQALTANWDAGAFKITAQQLESDVATGTAPLVVASTTVVTNLNVSSVGGKAETAFLLADGTRGLSGDWDAGAYEVRAQTFESDVATGTAPLTIASTTVVANLNVSALSGKAETAFVLVDGTRALTGSWDVGAYELRALTLQSDVATGTAPLTVASTTVVTNLNADTLDALHAASLTAVGWTWVIGDGVNAITTGEKAKFEVPCNCTLTQVTVVGLEASGSIVIDIWKDTYANYPPADADTITSASPPTITADKKVQDSTLTNWTTSFTKGDWLVPNVDSITTFTQVSLSMQATRT